MGEQYMWIEPVLPPETLNLKIMISMVFIAMILI